MAITRQEMTASPLICLSFGPEITARVRPRITYAFRVFAATYGYKVVQTRESEQVIRCWYGKGFPETQAGRTVQIPNLYIEDGDRGRYKPLIPLAYAGEQLYLHYGVDAASGRPDWLGELFRWISCSHEWGAAARDSVGRIPYGETVFGRQNISPRKPYAAVVMAWLENELQTGGKVEALPRASSPLPGGEHMVVCSHDIDFLYTGRVSALRRLVKNLAISWLLYRSWSFFAWNSRSILRLLNGRHIGDYIPGLVEASEAQGLHSTFFAVARKGHRRDPDYEMEEVQEQLVEAERRGFAVGLHSSYRSCIEEGTLTPEVAKIEKATGRRPLGSRQHWLRFGDHERLFDMVARAGLAYDSTLGFVETIGFRNGASFAFPPYDFRSERAYPFLEIPLVLMDGALQAAHQASKQEPQKMAEEILQESRKWGWGGISVLWHNPMEPIQVPDEINQVFWNCARKRGEHNEKWMSADEFLKYSLARYQNAGLLENVQIHD